jgi:hypothetical protein
LISVITEEKAVVVKSKPAQRIAECFLIHQSIHPIFMEGDEKCAFATKFRGHRTIDPLVNAEIENNADFLHTLRLPRHPSPAS